MFILCDTSSILMLIRIAPEMFNDQKYKCTTIPVVKKELFNTQKFKDKYPWRIQYKNKIKSVSMLELEEKKYLEIKNLVDNLIFSGTINENTGGLIDLSSEDRIITAFAKYKGFSISTGDKNLAAFAKQQFAINNSNPLEILNFWIREGIVVVEERVLELIREWAVNREAPQPKNAIKEFETLTKRKYPGS